MHAYLPLPVLNAHFVFEFLAQAFCRVRVLANQQLGPHFQNGDVTPEAGHGLRQFDANGPCTNQHQPVFKEERGCKGGDEG